MSNHLEKEHFLTFHQSYFSFKTLKEQKTPTEIEEIKKQFKKSWDDFKSWQLQSATKSALPFSKIRVESWTNGWRLRDHFWCPYRKIGFEKQAPCLAVMLDDEKLTIYLMYQHYKSESSSISPLWYNTVLKAAPKWYQTLTFSYPLFFWENKQEKLTDFIAIDDFTTLKKRSESFDSLQEKTFCLGFTILKETADISKVIAKGLQTLWPLYEKSLEENAN